MEQQTVERDSAETDLRRVWCQAAQALGFQERQAHSLAFWYWLARQRGETKVRCEPSAKEGYTAQGARRLMWNPFL